jgi:hypothetical protein
VINDSCFDEVSNKTERVTVDAFLIVVNNNVSELLAGGSDGG